MLGREEVNIEDEWKGEGEAEEGGLLERGKGEGEKESKEWESKNGD